MTDLVDLYRKLRPLQIIPVRCSDSSATQPAQTTQTTLSVLSYNLLAQHHIWSDTYPYCTAPGVLKWPYRREHLLAELEAYGPTDLMAFQEVGNFEQLWEGRLGPQVLFAPREDGKDGLCLVFNPARYTTACNPPFTICADCSW